MVISEIREWVWWTTVECWGAGTRKPQNLPASRRELGQLRWARAAAAQILSGLSSFTYTFFVVPIHGEKETNLMRISGDIATGSFACGGCRGSGVPGSSPARKTSWVERRAGKSCSRWKQRGCSRLALPLVSSLTKLNLPFRVGQSSLFCLQTWQSSPGGSPGSPARLSAKI